MNAGMLRALLGKRFRTRMIVGLVFGVLIAVLAWDLGLDAPHAAVIGVAVLIAVLIQAVLPDLDAPELPEPPSEAPDGVRQDVLALSFALREEKGAVRPAAIARLRGIAQARLLRLGLDLDAPGDRAAIERELGPSARMFVAEDVRPPGLQTVTACLDALDRLATHDDFAPDVPSAPTATTTSAPKRRARKETRA